MTRYLLAIDQGTTNSRAILFTQQGELLAQHEIALNQSFPRNGWVEQDPHEMFDNCLVCCHQVMQKLNLEAENIVGIGISNQRETTIVWDRITGKAIYPAIVWQDRRTHEFCQYFGKLPIAKEITAKTGLLLDPYFSATKIVWILDNVPDARQKAERGELAFGTVDTFLLWQFTQGKSHATDATNASRTMLFNIKTQQWDRELLAAFTIPENLLPTVFDCHAEFGYTANTFFKNPIAILGIAGDQQAALFGQACFEPGMVKTTYGTGAFTLLNTGKQFTISKHQLLSTIAYRINNKVTYGLEGSIFSAGTTIKWLRDSMKLIKTAEESESFAEKIHDTGGVYLVPAFTGLGAPHWDSSVRAAIFGLTRDSQPQHIVRAGLEACAYQTRDLLETMQAESGTQIEKMRVDGGMVANYWLLQFIADICNLEVDRPLCIETTALGVAFLAGLQAGLYQSLTDVAKIWQAKLEITPQMPKYEREKYYAGWTNALNALLKK